MTSQAGHRHAIPASILRGSTRLMCLPGFVIVCVVFDRLIDEHEAQGVTYSMVRAYVFQRLPEIRIEEGRVPPQAFVPQTRRPGNEAEVDFGNVWIHLNGVSTKVFLFSLRLSLSGKGRHRPPR
ncbi:hypothetical protein [Streptomyces cyaneofuscatus]|uniref:hypothetical protein n=1 Tax=Streptomyces cyaneofuscatus TaxID=66883 RepID=UPI003802EF6F